MGWDKSVSYLFHFPLRHNGPAFCSVCQMEKQEQVKAWSIVTPKFQNSTEVK